jgi:hypothetical protein
MEFQFYFLHSVKAQIQVGGGEWSASHPCCFTPRERAHGTHWIGCWAGPRASLDHTEKWKALTPSACS